MSELPAASGPLHTMTAEPEPTRYAAARTVDDVDVDGAGTAGSGESLSVAEAALEVLAIIAYRQPIARSGIELIRGSTCQVPDHCRPHSNLLHGIRTRTLQVIADGQLKVLAWMHWLIGSTSSRVLERWRVAGTAAEVHTQGRKQWP